MSGWLLRPAEPTDWPAIAQLLSQAALPLDGAESAIQHFFVAAAGRRVLGCACLERYGDHGLLRSVAVAGDAQGGGIAAALVLRLLAAGHAADLRSVALLTTTADRYFPRFGFARVPRAELPDRVKESVEFRSACPDTAVAMLLHLA